jgi:regulator of sigma E protease
VTFVELVKQGSSISLVLVIVALLSVNLGVVNILPLPALDGGRIVTTSFYSIIVRFFQKKESVFITFENYFHKI